MFFLGFAILPTHTHPVTAPPTPPTKKKKKKTKLEPEYKWFKISYL